MPCLPRLRAGRCFMFMTPSQAFSLRSTIIDNTATSMQIWRSEASISWLHPGKWMPLKKPKVKLQSVSATMKVQPQAQ